MHPCSLSVNHKDSPEQTLGDVGHVNLEESCFSSAWKLCASASLLCVPVSLEGEQLGCGVGVNLFLFCAQSGGFVG